MKDWQIECECGKVSILEKPHYPGLLVLDYCENCNKTISGYLPKSSDENIKYPIRQDTLNIYNAITQYFMEMKPRLTVRQIYYAMSVRGIVDKTENGYRQIANHLKNMRLKNIIPYGWLSDNSRYILKPTTYGGLHDALLRSAQFYRRSLWAEQETYVEIWIEKDALAGVINSITNEYDVPLMVVRGFSSMTFLYECAEHIKSLGKKHNYIYHFGDYDPSGVAAAESIEKGLKSHGANIHFKRIAITPEQITMYNLPTRETKKTDTRAKKFNSNISCELDAMPPNILRALVEESIFKHINDQQLAKTLSIEESEKATFMSLPDQFKTL